MFTSQFPLPESLFLEATLGVAGSSAGGGEGENHEGRQRQPPAGVSGTGALGLCCWGTRCSRSQGPATAAALQGSKKGGFVFLCF